MRLLRAACGCGCGQLLRAVPAVADAAVLLKRHVPAAAKCCLKHCGFRLLLRTLLGVLCNCGGCSGCDGEIYWSEWHNDPPCCCDPCNHCGQWVGPAAAVAAAVAAASGCGCGGRAAVVVAAAVRRL